MHPGIPKKKFPVSRTILVNSTIRHYYAFVNFNGKPKMSSDFKSDRLPVAIIFAISVLRVQTQARGYQPYFFYR